MEGFIFQLGIMSVQAAIVICVVLLVRAIFAKIHVPKKYLGLLWCVPYILMVWPWKIKSSFSFWRVPENEQMSRVQTAVKQVQQSLEAGAGSAGQIEGLRNDTGQNIGNIGSFANSGSWESTPTGNGALHTDAMNNGTINSGTLNTEVWNGGALHTEAVNSAADLTEQLSQTVPDINNSSMELVELLLQLAAVVWLVGLAVILVYSMVSYVKLKRKVLCSINVTENVYYADDIDSPFVLGIFKPRIYLPSSMQQENLRYVLEHERTHIRKWDPLKKMLAFGISVVHWFNPLAWVAFYFFGKDMEMACDEDTVARLGIENKQDYATALLQLASGKRMLLGAPLAFGEGNVKGRIRNIVKYKKVWGIVSAVAVVVIVVLAAGFLTKNDALTTLAELEQDGEEPFVGGAGEPGRIQLTMQGETTDLPEASFENFQEVEVEKEPVSLNYSEDAEAQEIQNKQLELIATQKRRWMMDTAYDLENYCFAVTDLDNNGRLEIISSYMSDWGQRSDNKFFEVSEAYEDLIRVTTDYAQEEYQPDILVDTITVYRDEKGVHYICYDYNNVYDEGTYESYQSLQFVDGKITGQLLCRKSTEFKHGKGLVTTYYDGEGGNITEEEYHQMVEKTFRNAHQWQVHIGWQDVAEFDDVSEQELVEALRVSLEAFSIQHVDKENVVGAYPTVEVVTEEFTMRDLIALCKEDKVAETMRGYVEKDGLLPTNIQRSYTEGALSWSYYYDLEYEGKSYTLRANYWNAANAQEYGHAPDQLYEVILYENNVKDALMLYSNDYRHAGVVPIMDIEEFLTKKYDISQYLSLELPEGTFLGDYSMTMNDIFQGSLIRIGEDYEEIPHGEWAPEAWYAPGGVGMTALTGNGAMEGRATFRDGKLVEFHWLMNHGGGEVVEVLEDCDMPAVLYHYNFDVFTQPEAVEYAEEHGMSIEEVPGLSDYWYVFFAEPDGEYAYTVFLNQAYFTKEDILELTRSVKFQ